MSLRSFGFRPFGLGPRLRRNRGFSPAAVFAANEPGIWLDPSDLSTLFQDNLGATPVTAVGQTVGLAMDKSQNRALGPELVANGSFASGNSGWALLGVGNTTTFNGGAAQIQGDTAPGIRRSGILTVGKIYQISLRVRRLVGTATMFLVPNTLLPVVGAEWVTITTIRGASNANFDIGLSGTATGSILEVTDISVREVLGNHAYQATAASRPVLGRNPASGVRNLANGSADVGNTSIWPASVVHNGVTATKIGSGIDTDGLPYVDYRYQGTATNTFHSTTYGSAISRNPASVGLTYTASAYSRMISGTTNNPNLRVAVVEETAPSTYIGQSSSNVAGETDTFLTASRTFSTGNQVRTEIILQMVNGAAIDVTYRIKGIQLELGAARTAFQFNYSSNNISEPGVADCYFLAFDGVDDFLVTNTLTPGTDKAQMFAGIRKLSDAARASVAEIDNGNTRVKLEAPNGLNNGYSFQSGATTIIPANVTTADFNAPQTLVLAGLGDVSADSVLLRANGVQVATGTGDQGSGNYAALPAYIGRSQGTAQPFNGRIYSLILRFGPNLSNWTLNQIEDWVNSKTGAWQAFLPASLFSSGEQGIWLDPSDFSTMFQDTGGFVPVTAPGQSVAIMLDKSQGLARGPELLGTGVVSQNGTPPSPATYDPVTGVGTAPRTDVSNMGYPLFAAITGAWYAVDVENTGTASISVRTGGTGNPIATLTAGQRRTVLLSVLSASITICNNDNNSTATYRLYSLSRLFGNHATQPTTASRPILGRNPATGIRNLLTFTEELTNSVWIKGTAAPGAMPVVTPNYGVAPDGTPTATRFQLDGGPSGGVGNSQVASSQFNVPSGQPNTVASVWLRSLAGDVLVTILSCGAVQNFNVTSEWQRVTYPRTGVTPGNHEIRIAKRDIWGTPGAADILVWHPQAEFGAVATNYQRVGASIDITEAGVPDLYYLAFDGVDDFLLTGTVTPGTDKAQVFAGVRKLSDAGTTGCVFETGTGAGSLSLEAPRNADAPDLGFTSRGSVAVNAISPATFPSPLTTVLAGLGDISGDSASLRVNGVQVAQTLTDQGTGQFIASVCYIGRRTGSARPFNGRIHSLICRFGPNLTNLQIEGAERHVDEKTRAY